MQHKRTPVGSQGVPGLAVSQKISPTYIHWPLICILTAIGLCFAVYSLIATPESEAPFIAKLFTVLWLVVSLLFSAFVMSRNFVAGWLGGMLALLIGWRIPGLLGVGIVSCPLLLVFIAYVLQFADAAFADRDRWPVLLLSRAEWHLALLRIYIGFDMVPHFTEKLFAGPGPFSEDVKAFSSFGMAEPGAFVVLGGLCELAIAIGIGAGFLTRLAAIGGTFYFMIATIIGGHFGMGFIWASKGGGWEYPVLMMVLMSSFLITGSGKFSIDQVVKDRGMGGGWWCK